MAGRRGGRDGGIPRIEDGDRLFEDAMALLGQSGPGKNSPGREPGLTNPRGRGGRPNDAAQRRPQLPPAKGPVAAHKGGPSEPARPTVSREDEDLFLAAVSGLDAAPAQEARSVNEPVPAPDRTDAPLPHPGIDVVADLAPWELANALDDSPPQLAPVDAPQVPVQATPSQVMDAKRFRQLLDKRRMKVQADLDLHGVRSLDAVDEVRHFIHASREAGLKVVRIVHGKGHHSEGGPVLRDLVRRLLRTELEDTWTALTSPPEHMGGDGATVLHLKAQRRPADT